MRIRNHFLASFSLPMAVPRAASMAKDLLPPGYQDRMAGLASVSAAEYAVIADRFSRLCAEVDLGGIWSFMLLEGRIAFTSASIGVGSARGGPPGFLDAAPDPRLPGDPVHRRKAVRLLRKPYQRNELLRAVREILDEPFA